MVVAEIDSQDGKVHLPDHLEGSDGESESFSDKLRNIGAFPEDAQCSQANESSKNQQA